MPLEYGASLRAPPQPRHRVRIEKIGAQALDQDQEDVRRPGETHRGGVGLAWQSHESLAGRSETEEGAVGAADQDLDLPVQTYGRLQWKDLFRGVDGEPPVEGQHRA